MSCTPNNSSAGSLSAAWTARSLGAALLGTVLLAAGTAAQAADAAEIDFQAMGWASSCVSCHGAAQAIDGSTVASLAGMPADEMVSKMEAFAAGDAPGSLMQQIARGYDHATLVRIAQWYQNQAQETK